MVPLANLLRLYLPYDSIFARMDFLFYSYFAYCISCITFLQLR